ncbi:NUDIX domain-containing protein [Pseudonocardia sp. WMMC193]|uniref:NUDIX domain-containing protein n=1 Tax=Pseudonocardia sp. WMMC193 TaxID=2911965 RepID=UPI001F44E3BC|nr:NUDIX domain-containing protein [Pseudonocardia sp. WMMC193]MCF7548962.1 NUDIX domain-containing protein [Pseudonocardia sp. WMMC193]
MDEILAVYSPFGEVVGSATRTEVYARSLWHGSAGVILCDGDLVYAHRRADTKQVMPGLWDCVAGGVVDAGEDPYDTAVRELGEELGVHGVALEFLHSAAWESGPGPGLGGPEGLRCHLFAWTAQWHGPVVHQPSEVAEGRWVSRAELRTLLAGPFAPDSRLLAEALLTTRER